MSTLKSKHIATVGRVRLSLLAGRAPRKSEVSDFTIERRRDENAESWYPAAGFHINELDSLAQAVELARQHRDGSASKETAAPDEPAPAAPATPSPAPATAVSEEPPFDPTGPAAPVVVSTRGNAARPSSRSAERTAGKKKTRRVNPVKAKARSRSR